MDSTINYKNCRLHGFRVGVDLLTCDHNFNTVLNRELITEINIDITNEIFYFHNRPLGVVIYMH